jgi:hypothetical protein
MHAAMGARYACIDQETRRRRETPQLLAGKAYMASGAQIPRLRSARFSGDYLMVWPM